MIKKIIIVLFFLIITIKMHAIEVYKSDEIIHMNNISWKEIYLQDKKTIFSALIPSEDVIAVNKYTLFGHEWHIYTGCDDAAYQIFVYWKDYWEKHEYEIPTKASDISQYFGINMNDLWKIDLNNKDVLCWQFATLEDVFGEKMFYHGRVYSTKNALYFFRVLKLYSDVKNHELMDTFFNSAEIK